MPMSSPNCTKDRYLSNDRCCRRCEAGTYKQKDCDDTTETQCSECGQGSFMATSNHMDKCRKCKTCNHNNLILERACTARTDTVCACVSGFYCSEASCEHCYPVSHCPEGEGVRTLASRTNNTDCSPCETGTFSNVSDHVSKCRPHTRCDDIGRELLTPGTATADAVCGNIKTSCDWMLPAGLWIGLVLTSLTVFTLVLVLWRVRRRRLQRAVSLSQPEALVDVVLETEVQLKLPLPSQDLNELYPEEIYKPSYSCVLPAFESDALRNSCDAQDTVDSSVPITPFKASVSFSEAQRLNSNGSYHRTISEPQEDEWCGT